MSTAGVDDCRAAGVAGDFVGVGTDGNGGLTEGGISRIEFRGAGEQHVREAVAAIDRRQDGGKDGGHAGVELRLAVDGQLKLARRRYAGAGEQRDRVAVEERAPRRIVVVELTGRSDGEKRDAAGPQHGGKLLDGRGRHARRDGLAEVDRDTLHSTSRLTGEHLSVATS